MKIYFFESEKWEEQIIKKAFPDAILISEPLTNQNCHLFPDAEIISVFICSILNNEIIQKLPNLKCIATRSTGYDHIDIASCKARNITVCNVPEYGSVTVAEYTFALLLSLTRKIYQSVNQAKTFHFDHNQLCGIDLFQKRIGIIGLGKIGSHVLRISRGFGMKALVYTRTKDPVLEANLKFRYTDTLQELLEQSDIISLHLPYCEATKHTINKENIKYIKKGAYIVNTARGGLIETEALIMALEQNILAGVGLDVLEGEIALTEEVEVLTEKYKQNTDWKTLVLDYILINHPKVLITPHNAFNSNEALMRIENTNIDTINQFIIGKKINNIA